MREHEFQAISGRDLCESLRESGFQVSLGGGGGGASYFYKQTITYPEPRVNWIEYGSVEVFSRNVMHVLSEI